MVEFKKIKEYDAARAKPVRYPERMWAKYKSDLLKCCHQSSAREAAALFSKNAEFRPSIHQINTKIAKWRKARSSELLDAVQLSILDQLQRQSQDAEPSSRQAQTSTKQKASTTPSMLNSEIILTDGSSIAESASKFIGVDKSRRVTKNPSPLRHQIVIPQPSKRLEMQESSVQSSPESGPQSRQLSRQHSSPIQNAASIAHDVSRLPNFSRVINLIIALLPSTSLRAHSNVLAPDNGLSDYQIEILAVFSPSLLMLLTDLAISRLQAIADVISMLCSREDAMCMHMFLWCISAPGSLNQRQNIMRCLDSTSINAIPQVFRLILLKIIDCGCRSQATMFHYILTLIKTSCPVKGSDAGRILQGLKDLLALRTALQRDSKGIWSERLHEEIMWYEREVAQESLSIVLDTGNHCLRGQSQRGNIAEDLRFILTLLEDDWKVLSLTDVVSPRYGDIVADMLGISYTLEHALSDLFNAEASSDTEQSAINSAWQTQYRAYKEASTVSLTEDDADCTALYLLVLQYLPRFMQGYCAPPSVRYLSNDLPKLLYHLSSMIRDCPTRIRSSERSFCERLQEFFVDLKVLDEENPSNIENMLEWSVQYSIGSTSPCIPDAIGLERLRQVLTPELLDLLSGDDESIC